MGHRAMSLGFGTGVNATKAVPTLSAVAPNNGAAAGGTAVTFTGTNFDKSPAIGFKIGGAPCHTVVVAVGGLTATAVTGAHDAEADCDAIVTLDGVAITLPDAYEYT